MEAMSEPSDEQLTDSVQLALDTNPSMGVKKLVTHIKAEHPAWAESINTARIRAILHVLDVFRSPQQGQKLEVTASAAKSSAGSESTGGGSLLEARIDLIQDAGPLPLAQREIELEFVVTLLEALCKDRGVALVDRPSVLEKQKRGPYAAITDTYRLFYANWNNWMGPPRHQPMAAPKLHTKDFEAKAFPMLFPSGQGHYMPSMGITIDEYIVRMLQGKNSRFRKSQLWLRWALTETRDKEVEALINLVFVGLHGMKARHIGGGEVCATAKLLNDNPSFRRDSEGQKVLVEDE